MVETAKKLWRVDLFFLFCYNLLGLVGTLYVFITSRSLPLLAIVAFGGNIFCLAILLLVRTRVMTHIIDEASSSANAQSIADMLNGISRHK